MANESALPTRQLAAALLALGDEVSRCHFRMNAVLQRVHCAAAPERKGDDPTPGRRAVLRNLVAWGPQTVPQLAALRPVSRQYMRRVVDGLVSDGLAARMPNHAHRRSPLITVTVSGRAHLEAMLARELPLFAGAALAAGTIREVETCAALLVRLRGYMDGLLADVDPPSGTPVATPIVPSLAAPTEYGW